MIRQLPAPFRQRGAASMPLLSALGVLIVIGALFVTYQFVDPAPPKELVIATGSEGGAYQTFGQEYADYLAGEGIAVTLQETAGSTENLSLLTSESGVDLAFVQSGLATPENSEGLVGIGSLYPEPLLFFISQGIDYQGIESLRDRRISIGEEGSGTRSVALNLLAAIGVGADLIQPIAIEPIDVAGALTSGEIDGALIVGDPESEYVLQTIREPGVTLVGMPRASAFERRFPYLARVELPFAVLDLERNLPQQDVVTVATTAMLVAREDLHPALVDLLLVAARQIHGGHSLLADPGQYPSPNHVDIPLSEEAERHFRRGPPFLMRYLPFWAATLVDRLWVMLLPLIGLAIPLVKLIPPLYQWQIRRRFLKLYRELQGLDPSVNELSGSDDAGDRAARLDRLERQAAVASVPNEYKDAIYKLRRDIDLVRRRLSRATID